MIEGKPDILAVIQSEGIELRRRGRDHWACCPFHMEKSPSFKISEEKQLWYCFGCGEGGDVITFVQKLHGLSFRDACVHLGIAPGRPAPIDFHRLRMMEAQKRFAAAVWTAYESLCDQSISLHKIRLQVKRHPGTLTEEGMIRFAQQMGQLAETEHRLDVFLYGSAEDQIQLLKKVNNDSSTFNRIAA
jgi:DNA primase